jgi:transcription-repair coupling factor (superfamily II helicase)
VDASDSTIQIQFVPNPPVDGQRVIALIQKNRNYRLAGPDRLRIALDTGAVTERVDAVRGVLRALAA